MTDVTHMTDVKVLGLQNLVVSDEAITQCLSNTNIFPSEISFNE